MNESCFFFKSGKRDKKCNRFQQDFNKERNKHCHAFAETTVYLSTSKGEMFMRRLILFIVFAVILSSPVLAQEMSERERLENSVPFEALPWKDKVPVLGGLLDSLPQIEIDDLAVQSKYSVEGTGKRIDARRLSFAALEDTYLRILVSQRKITPERALGLWKKLHGLEGFRATVRKISSSNSAQRIGHMFELELAEAAPNVGLTPISIGRKFDDGQKSARTDLDVWLRCGETNIYIEAKNYETITFANLPHFRADMDSLVSLGPGLRIFALRRLPRNPDVTRALELAAKQRSVLLMNGPAERIVQQIRELCNVESSRRTSNENPAANLAQQKEHRFKQKIAKTVMPFEALPWKGGVPMLGKLPDSLLQAEIDNLAALSEHSVKEAGKQLGL